MMNVVLLEPEIHMNTGNIGRTCVAAGARLHLIEPLGFRLDEKMIKRAGLDYWEQLDLHVYENFSDFLDKNPGCSLFMASTKAPRDYSQVKYTPESYIMFGKESAGIPEEILAKHPDQAIRIPMMPSIRSLNLANSVAIVLYEALRQNDFPGMQMQGSLRNYDWT